MHEINVNHKSCFRNKSPFSATCSLMHQAVIWIMLSSFPILFSHSGNGWRNSTSLRYPRWELPLCRRRHGARAEPILHEAEDRFLFNKPHGTQEYVIDKQISFYMLVSCLHSWLIQFITVFANCYNTILTLLTIVYIDIFESVFLLHVSA
jgi:hypothetical protein